MRMRTFLVISAIIAVLIGGGIYFVVSSADAKAANEKTKAPTNLICEWKQVDANTGDILAQAEISAGSIQINLKTRDSSSIYWLGSFDTDTDPAALSEVTSLGDTDAMSASLFGSQDKTKKFVYENGELTYKFTMMGSTKTVRLVKE